MAIREASEAKKKERKAQIYVVSVNRSVRRVRAISQAQAIKKVTTPAEAHIAGQDELVELLKNGTEVEEGV